MTAVKRALEAESAKAAKAPSGRKFSFGVPIDRSAIKPYALESVKENLSNSPLDFSAGSPRVLVTCCNRHEAYVPKNVYSLRI